MMEYLGFNIKSRREMMGISQKDLAKKVGVTQAAIFFYESGKSIPRLDIAIALANTFGITVEQLASIPVPDVKI